MDALTINEAARTTGWSARMLRYIEQVGLVEPARSGSGYRLYGAPELQRLRTLDVDTWFESEAQRPADVAPSDWLRFEQDKHERLLAAAAQLI